jgi:DNA-binding transcriptional regulator LsrR (DeoR family)
VSPLAAQILALHRGKKISQAAIARQLGCSEVRVHQVLRDAGIAKPAHLTRTSVQGPAKRADGALRKFSWESAE